MLFFCSKNVINYSSIVSKNHLSVLSLKVEIFRLVSMFLILIFTFASLQWSVKKRTCRSAISLNNSGAIPFSSSLVNFEINVSKISQTFQKLWASGITSKWIHTLLLRWNVIILLKRFSISFLRYPSFSLVICCQSIVFAIYIFVIPKETAPLRFYKSHFFCLTQLCKLLIFQYAQRRSFDRWSKPSLSQATDS